MGARRDRRKGLAGRERRNARERRWVEALDGLGGGARCPEGLRATREELEGREVRAREAAVSTGVLLDELVRWCVERETPRVSRYEVWRLVTGGVSRAFFEEMETPGFSAEVRRGRREWLLGAWRAMRWVRDARLSAVAMERSAEAGLSVEPEPMRVRLRAE